MSEAAKQSSRRYRPVLELVLARLREFVREPEAVMWTYGFPIVMTVALGIAFRNRPIERITVTVVDGPAAAGMREALTAAETADRFQVKVFPTDEARRQLRTGRTDVVVARENSPTDSRPHYTYQFDPTRPESVLARRAVDDQLQRAAGRKDSADTTLEEMKESGGRYIDFLIPGLLGMNLMGGGLWGIGFVTVDMRVRKLLKRFLATPMKKTDFLLGVMLSRMIFMVPEVLVILVFARYAFGVVSHGSTFAVTFLIVLGAVMFSGIGLLAASRAKTIEGVSGIMNLTMVPMWIFSGIFFSPDRFPDAVQPFIQALPLTPLISSIRAVMLEGLSLSELITPIAIMAAWSTVSFVLALRWFRWR